MEISESDVATFWSTFVPLVQQHRSNLCTAAAIVRDGSAFPRRELEVFEIILTRLSWTLAAKLQPLVFSATSRQIPAANCTSVSSTAAVNKTKPAEQLGSFFDLSLLCHHIILHGGEDLYCEVLNQPAQALRAVMPLVADGSHSWCACSPSVAAEEHAEEQKSDSPQRLSTASGFVMWAVLRYEVLCLHATKFRLNRKTCAPNNISSSVENAGFFELFDHIAAAVPLPSTPLEKESLGDWGAQQEMYPTFQQDEQLCWVEQRREEQQLPNKKSA